MHEVGISNLVTLTSRRQSDGMPLPRQLEEGHDRSAATEVRSDKEF